MLILNEQWEDSLRSQRYPFASTGNVVSTNGQILPEDTFLDLNLMVDSSTETVLMTSMTIADATVVYRFELSDGTLVGTLTSADGDPSEMPIMLGTLVVGYALMETGAASIVRGLPAGVYQFRNVQVIPHLLVVSDKHWRRGFELPDGTALTGDIYLVADKGLWLERTATGFKLHCTGDPFNGRTTPARGLLTLNGESPDANGNINLIGLSPTNFSGTTFVASGNAFRINLLPGTGQLTIQLVGA